MRYALTQREIELTEKVKPYAVYPPVNGYPIRPGSPKEIFDAVDELRRLDKEHTQNID